MRSKTGIMYDQEHFGNNSQAKRLNSAKIMNSQEATYNQQKFYEYIFIVLNITTIQRL